MASPEPKNVRLLKKPFRGKRLRELYTDNRGLIHRTDARVKVIFILAFLIFLNLTPSNAWPAHLLFFALIFFLALVSRVGMDLILKRSLSAMPFVLAALPLIFTSHTPQDQITLLNGLHITYSVEGLSRFSSIALKSWISVIAAVLLAATTQFPDQLKALEWIKVPKLFVTIIALMWRYMFVISDEVTRLLRARTSRSAIAAESSPIGGTIFWRAQITGGMAGSLFLRSIERSDRIYAAMLSRGYTGELLPNETSSLSKRELLTLILGIILLGLFWVLGMVNRG